MSTSLVLSGGAAQGSFEIGALDYVYRRGFVANSICSTSVGSVNGLLLAHDGTGPGQAARFALLKGIWETELMSNADMCDEAPWLAGVTPRTRAAIDRLFSGEVDVPSLAASAIFFPPYAIGQAIALGTDLADALIALGQASSVFTLAPTRTKIEKNLHPDSVASSGVELRMVVVSLDSGAIRYITQDGRVIETDGRKVYGPNPSVCTVERNGYNRAMAAKTAAGHAVSIASPEDRMEAIAEYKAASDAADMAKAALDACISQAVTDGVGDHLTVGLADGAIASSSIPCVFPPTVLGDEAYVDGGIRWTLPLLTAIDLDPERIVAVSTSPAAIPAPAQGFEYRNASILDIAERSVLGLQLFETQDQHVHAARLEAANRRQQVWVIFPRFVVHDGFTVDPGLIDINIAYGHMCAADVLTAFEFPTLEVGGVPPDRPKPVGPVGPVGPAPRPDPIFVDVPTDPALGALADAIARCRRECWDLEHHVFAQERPGMFFTPRHELVALPDLGALGELRTRKTLLGLLVQVRRDLHASMPLDAPSWADRWERHQWAVADVPGSGNTPWDAFQSGGQTLPAATRPNALVAKAPDRDEVWLLNPTRHWITTPDVLMRFGGWDVVTEVADWYIDALPRGEDIV
jgi:NTE family protein